MSVEFSESGFEIKRPKIGIDLNKRGQRLQSFGKFIHNHHFNKQSRP